MIRAIDPAVDTARDRRPILIGPRDDPYAPEYYGRQRGTLANSWFDQYHTVRKGIARVRARRLLHAAMSELLQVRQRIAEVDAVKCFGAAPGLKRIRVVAVQPRVERVTVVGMSEVLKDK